MKRIFTKNAEAGNILAKDVYGSRDTLILKGGTVLTPEHIYSMMMQNIDTIVIEENTRGNAKRKTETVVSEYQKRLMATDEFKKFDRQYEEELDKLKGSINNIVSKNADENDIRQMVTQTINITKNITPGVNVFDMLNSMKSYDDSTFAHCINVSLICHVFAKWLDMSEEEVRIATECGLFHDIGKVMIPIEVIAKPGKLTSEEYDVIKTHAMKGYEILKNYDCIEDDVKMSALMHHEKCDGSGYPLGLKGDKINKYAKMVAIADIYDAMTSARVYRGPLCPFKVIQIFEEEGLTKYDPKYIMTFLTNVADTYMQSDVLLSDGRRGKIVYINKNEVSRPIVKCGEEFLDLSKEKNLTIEKLI